MGSPAAFEDRQILVDTQRRVDQVGAIVGQGCENAVGIVIEQSKHEGIRRSLPEFKAMKQAPLV